MRLWNPESKHVQELAKWEMNPSEWTIGRQPGNPYIKGNPNKPDHEGRGGAGAEYPRMLYRAQRLPGVGKFATMMSTPPRHQFPNDNAWDNAREAASEFTRQCQLTVKSEDEHLKARGQGWRDTYDEAMALAQAEQDNLGNERAERDYRDRNMSEKALAEKEAFDAANFGHNPEVKESPLPPRPVARGWTPEKRQEAARKRAETLAKKAQIPA